MPLIRQTCAAALLVPMLAVPAHAQVSRLPMEVQEVLATLGPKWGTALRENIDATAAAFRPLLKAAPKDGVIVGKNLAYGESGLFRALSDHAYSERGACAGVHGHHR